MLTIAIALCVCVLGAILFMITDKKPAQLGLYAFAVGLLVTLMSISGSVSIEAHPAPAHVR